MLMVKNKAKMHFHQIKQPSKLCKKWKQPNASFNHWLKSNFMKQILNLIKWCKHEPKHLCQEVDIFLTGADRWMDFWGTLHAKCSTCQYDPVLTCEPRSCLCISLNVNLLAIIKIHKIVYSFTFIYYCVQMIMHWKSTSLIYVISTRQQHRWVGFHGVVQEEASLMSYPGRF